MALISFPLYLLSHHSVFSGRFYKASQGSLSSKRQMSLYPEDLPQVKSILLYSERQVLHLQHQSNRSADLFQDSGTVIPHSRLLTTQRVQFQKYCSHTCIVGEGLASKPHPLCLSNHADSENAVISPCGRGKKVTKRTNTFQPSLHIINAELCGYSWLSKSFWLWCCERWQPENVPGGAFKVN